MWPPAAASAVDALERGARNVNGTGCAARPDSGADRLTACESTLPARHTNATLRKAVLLHHCTRVVGRDCRRVEPSRSATTCNYEQFRKVFQARSRRSGG